MNNIIVKNAYKNNLKHIDVEIPRGKLVVFAGVSGTRVSANTLSSTLNKSPQSTTKIFTYSAISCFILIISLSLKT